MERIINDRLNEYLEMTRRISGLQCGCRRRRSTVDHLVRLESAIRKAFVNGENFVSVFFDLENAYDTTWRYGIIRNMFRKGLKGRLPMFIEKFLENRSFKVRIGSTYSDSQIQLNLIPQGSVISVTLFAMKIDQIIDMIPSEDGFHPSLFMDDLQVWFRHHDLRVIESKLQACLNSVALWATENGYRFSPTKTSVMHFTVHPGLHLRTNLTIYNKKIEEYTESFKFWGLIRDGKLTFKKHLSELKAKCQKPLALLRYITSLRWGTYQKLMKMIYNTQVRSRLDYGCIVYMSASGTNLMLISSIRTEALRIITGAFKTTPISALRVMGFELTLELRREQLALQYFYKICSYLDNPACAMVRQLQQS